MRFRRLLFALSGIMMAALAASSVHAQAQTTHAALDEGSIAGDQTAPTKANRALFAPLPFGAGQTGFSSNGITPKKKSGRTTSKKTLGVSHPLKSELATSKPLITRRLPRLYEQPPRKRIVADPQPFEPIGIRAGGVFLRPSLELSRGYDSNPSRTPNGGGAWFTRASPEILVWSDWSRHEMRAELRGGTTRYQEMHDIDRSNVDTRISGRIDVTHLTRIDLETHYLLATNNPGSPDFQFGLAKLPFYSRVGGTAGIGHRFNRFDIALKGAFDRVEYEESTLENGATASNATRNYDQYGGVLRGAYELLPGVKPFAEIGGDTRVHEMPRDISGFERDSRGVTARAGTTFELSRLLTGEASIGYTMRRYEDPRLSDLRGLIADASLIWAATPLTSVKLAAKSEAEETTLSGVSGILRRDVFVQVDHSFRRWLLGTVTLGFGSDAFEGDDREDKRYLASASLTYKMTRSVHLKGELRREWRASNEPGNDYTANIALVGLKLQH